MGSSYTDTFSGMHHFPDGMAQPDSELVTGTLLVEADAYGDLILPWGTVTNVLRLHKVRNTTDQNGITTLEQYLFYQPGEHEPWLTLNSWSYSWNTNAYQNAQYRPQTNNGIADMNGRSSFTLYPNPVNDQLMIRCDVEVPGNFTFDLIDVAGRTLLSKRPLSLTLGSFVQLDVSALAPGTYRLRIVTPDRTMLLPFTKG
ncbi:MAG: T9SS type A sorting domain-containing protein [Flavobacteriales bacterium]|nr:T9SS type A sorting domain-containing protein [Flavobacteriales bacterium]